MRGTKSTLYIRSLLFLAALLRFTGLGAPPLIGDEAYYWLWSRRLDWAYYDHPAGVAWLIRASTSLGGQTAFGIRWLNAALGVLCVALLYRVGARMLTRRAGRFAATMVAIGAPYLLIARFVYTDTLFMCLLLCNLWAFWAMAAPLPARPTHPTSRLTHHVSRITHHVSHLTFGLTLALLLNTKYTAYLYCVALGLAIVLEHRQLLRSKTFWLNVVIGALGLLPVLGWNLAHDWASIRWQLTHLVTASPGSSASALPMQWLGNARHAFGYITWPVMILSAIGLLRVRRPAARLLALAAAIMLAPVLLSPANSPRNLIAGLALLLLLAGHRKFSVQSVEAIFKAGLAVLLLATFAYGVGTVAALNGAPGRPHSALWNSSIVHEIRRDGIDGRALAAALSPYPAPFFTVDYDLAGRIHYETGRTALSGWGQFAIWGYPDWERGTVLSWDYVPAACITARLHAVFERVDGPETLHIDASAGPRTLLLWEVAGARLSPLERARALDFLTLWEVCR